MHQCHRAGPGRQVPHQCRRIRRRRTRHTGQFRRGDRHDRVRLRDRQPQHPARGQLTARLPPRRAGERRRTGHAQPQPLRGGHLHQLAYPGQRRPSRAGRDRDRGVARGAHRGQPSGQHPDERAGRVRTAARVDPDHALRGFHPGLVPRADRHADQVRRLFPGRDRRPVRARRRHRADPRRPAHAGRQVAQHPPHDLQRGHVAEAPVAQEQRRPVLARRVHGVDQRDQVHGRTHRVRMQENTVPGRDQAAVRTQSREGVENGGPGHVATPSQRTSGVLGPSTTERQIRFTDSVLHLRVPVSVPVRAPPAARPPAGGRRRGRERAPDPAPPPPADAAGAGRGPA